MTFSVLVSASLDVYIESHHIKELQELDVSDETFRNDRNEAEIIDLLVAGGIPKLPTSDIVSNAKRYFKKQHELATAPMAVFWDVENMPIPKELSGLEVIEAIKKKLAPFGNLEAIRAYSDISAGCPPVEKRSDLQLSGCHLIDTPHMNRKEVADKMIIVDALLYVAHHMTESGTLCFITGDTDYAYLLSRLRELQKLRTILVSNRAKQILDGSAGYTLSWKRDILGLDPAGRPDEPAASTSSAPVTPSSGPTDSSSHTDEDVEILRSIMQDFHRDENPRPLKSLVSSKLKEKNPLRFASKGARNAIFEAAMKKGIIEQGPTGPQQVCYLALTKTEKAFPVFKPS